MTDTAKTSKTLVGRGFGGVDVIKVEQRPIPEPQDGELLINIKATGVNFAQLMVRQGMYIKLPDIPYVFGVEAGGIVESRGPNCKSDLKVRPIRFCSALSTPRIQGGGS